MNGKKTKQIRKRVNSLVSRGIISSDEGKMPQVCYKKINKSPMQPNETTVLGDCIRKLVKNLKKDYKKYPLIYNNFITDGV